MDKSTLISTFAEADISGWSLQADVQVLKWLEEFSERFKRKASNVTENVHKLLELTGDVEQDFYNTFNSFRALSNTQYIENRVYEADDIGDPNLDFSIQFSEASLPAQGYEEDIVPRYKEALVTGWNAYRQYIQKTSRNTSEAIPHKVGWNDGNLPHIIGTEEFMRDNSCGLTDDRNLGMDPLDFSSDAEREGNYMESEMAGSRTLLEANWPETDLDRDDQVGVEPAVSAALDFKAMLEAALRSPYIPYNDGISNLNGTSSYLGNIGDSFITAEAVAIDSLSLMIGMDLQMLPVRIQMFQVPRGQWKMFLRIFRLTISLLLHHHPLELLLEICLPSLLLLVRNFQQLAFKETF